jgi:cytochrome c peroxidase
MPIRLFLSRRLWAAALVVMAASVAAWRLWPQPLPRLPAPPHPPGNPASPARVALGRMLFFDPVLSGDQRMSCATCHDPAHGFMDPRGFSIGSDGKPRPRRTPTVANLAYSRALFADGRAGSLEEQALVPLLGRSEMAGHVEAIRARLTGNAEYRELFERAFPGEPIDLPLILQAIAAYERTLVVSDTPYDRWARGDRRALSKAAKRGYALFNGKANCAGCHPAPLFGSDDLDPIGTPDRDAAGRLVRGSDPGLARLTGSRDDFGAFRATSLRRAVPGGPFMHNGAFRTLEEVVEFYDRGGATGLGLKVPRQDAAVRKLHLTAREKRDLVEFLRALRQKRPIDHAPQRVPSGLHPGLDDFQGTLPEPDLPHRIRGHGNT